MALRFAPVIRVSTEGQEKKNESLRTQTTQIKQYVEALKGIVPDHSWRYVGQEHATPNQERAKLDRLLADSDKNLFDAVIVCDASRWSRDNLKSKTGLEILRKNGIKFFVGTMEYDLFNPEHAFYLGVSAEIGELQARQQSLKSITNRIHRAKRGIPTCGKLPYGRTFDKESQTWGIDPDKQAKIQQAAQRYLAGESLRQIAASYGMNTANLWNTLKNRSGDTLHQTFHVPNLNIDEVVDIKMPRLLDEETIAAIYERTSANKTFTHGSSKHRYLLSRMIFCATCGYALFGQANNNTKLYYRHSRHRKKDCPLTKWISASAIENSVLIHLVQTFGDQERLKTAVEKATPDIEKMKLLKEEQKSLSTELKRIISQKDNVIDMVADGLLSKEEVKTRMEKLRASEAGLEARLYTIEEQLENAPDPDKVKKLSKLGMAVFADATKNPKLIFKKSYEWKRNLLEHAFGGKDAHGQRLGVYVTQTGDEDQPWEFEIRGLLENTILGLPLPDEYLEEAFKLDPEFQDIPKELKSIRDTISSFSTSSCPIPPRRSP